MVGEIDIQPAHNCTAGPITYPCESRRPKWHKQGRAYVWSLLWCHSRCGIAAGDDACDEGAGCDGRVTVDSLRLRSHAPVRALAEVHFHLCARGLIHPKI